MELKFELGDVVRLKSGGPAMTVNRVKTETENMVETVWFDTAGQKHFTKSFSYVLTKAQPSVSQNPTARDKPLF